MSSASIDIKYPTLGKTMPPVIVLAGGKGTRLASVVSDRPKIMAMIGDKPFIELLIAWLVKHQVSKLCFSLGHMAESVVAYLSENQRSLSERFPSLTIEYVIEPEPMGTGGGLAYSLQHIQAIRWIDLSAKLGTECIDDKNPLQEAIVLNGDSWSNIDLAGFVVDARESKSAASMCSVQVDNCGRYGHLSIDEETLSITKFNEKDESLNSPGWINAGGYYFSGEQLVRLVALRACSLENEVFAKAKPGMIRAFKASAEFIDFGTPESYKAAQSMSI